MRAVFTQPGDVVTTLPIVFAFFHGILFQQNHGTWSTEAMFLKRLERRKNGKAHTYWALVESYRTAKGSPPNGRAPQRQSHQRCAA